MSAQKLPSSGATDTGNCRTVERFPLVVAGPWFAPMMFNEPGTGYYVHGELYRVDALLVDRLDRLESVGTPDNFRVPILGHEKTRVAVRVGTPDNFRVPILVEPVSLGLAVSAFAFMKSRNLAKPIHSPLLECYMDKRFIPPWQRWLTLSRYLRMS